jgi:zinc transporter 11
LHSLFFFFFFLNSFFFFQKDFAWVPPAVGFVAGAIFIALCDALLDRMGASDLDALLVEQASAHPHDHDENDEETGAALFLPSHSDVSSADNVRRRRPVASQQHIAQHAAVDRRDADRRRILEERKRVMLLVLAVTVHNLPEGLAVGVGFGSVGRAAGATFERARNLAIGIGLQNFPEGFAVSMPLYRHGEPLWKCVFYGQLSGMVEPLGGFLGAWAVVHVEPLLPYALAFAAGAMIFVVVDSLVPEIVHSGNRFVGSWGCMVGFVAMMVMDLAL